MSKPAVQHPFSTNTGQILLSDLIADPHLSMWFKFGAGGTGVPSSPTQIDPNNCQDELVLLVFPQLDILVGASDLAIPTLGTAGVAAHDTIILTANHYHLLQWPYQYFNPIPFVDPTEDKYIFLNALDPQNSTGDTFKLVNR